MNVHQTIKHRLRELSHFAVKLVLGLPDYNVYVSHMSSTHPDQQMMSREEFYRDRHTARYTAVRGRCC